MGRIFKYKLGVYYGLLVFFFFGLFNDDIFGKEGN
jgi:hypothetical protein